MACGMIGVSNEMDNSNKHLTSATLFSLFLLTNS